MYICLSFIRPDYESFILVSSRSLRKYKGSEPFFLEYCQQFHENGSCSNLHSRFVGETNIYLFLPDVGKKLPLKWVLSLICLVCVHNNYIHLNDQILVDGNMGTNEQKTSNFHNTISIFKDIL